GTRRRRSRGARGTWSCCCICGRRRGADVCRPLSLARSQRTGRGERERTGGDRQGRAAPPPTRQSFRAPLFFARMRILLTGAAGFIGSHLAERLCARGDDVVGFDNFDPFYPRAVKERNLAGLAGRGNFRLVEGDITSPADVARAFEAG